jgi:hypothetical protein
MNARPPVRRVTTGMPEVGTDAEPRRVTTGMED